jgi:hypothetical protein
MTRLCVDAVASADLAADLSHHLRALQARLESRCGVPSETRVTVTPPLACVLRECLAQHREIHMGPGHDLRDEVLMLEGALDDWDATYLLAMLEHNSARSGDGNVKRTREENPVEIEERLYKEKRDAIFREMTGTTKRIDIWGNVVEDVPEPAPLSREERYELITNAMGRALNFKSAKRIKLGRNPCAEIPLSDEQIKGAFSDVSEKVGKVGNLLTDYANVVDTCQDLAQKITDVINCQFQKRSMPASLAEDEFDEELTGGRVPEYSEQMKREGAAALIAETGSTGCITIRTGNNFRADTSAVIQRNFKTPTRSSTTVTADTIDLEMAKARSGRF